MVTMLLPKPALLQRYKIMVYAIIDAVSDVEELITVAYGDRAYELARWFIDEVKDTADMYLSAQEDFDTVDKACEDLEVLCEDEDSSEVADIDGITVEAGEISVSVIGAYHSYEEMKAGLEAFISEKPKFKKIKVPDNLYEDEKLIDKLNSELIRSTM